ncbi:homodimeric glycerol 3-phosphate dehydrogenase (quinone) [Roseovarius nanhaiticus]|uniref:Glycerol-3-phosphate dehydrogenase n=1 Tax=Roseovarius nanhaiticus TaxID=573024 RepID=A0A1N7HLM8_9RHOB|nr:glycerol-3-phosphate dehydrogenase [Roseovarius nanhaiticus]SEL27302.1 homodimeric glycerol 3-phosphate dehydrogenase (quinone) [Roseovarius nanhaiticus]SIS25580.1 homodimeric glycerol 3-phosphate dehydrogenase (quinone) [Roseovarius nanhaiticus]
MVREEEVCDLFVIGGGINGCGVARDAAGRGLTVTLAEMSDLASATSSASTKLFHGGLRYLEYFEFRLVRESLIERETLLRAMPHISWPMRFVLPYHKDMRFEGDTPTSKLLNGVMPWMRGRRPAWLIRLGLFLYDHLGGRKILPGTSTVDLMSSPEGRALQERFTKAYEYSDCWVEDSRLVVLNARDAEARGARIMTRTRVVSAKQEDGIWSITTEDADTKKTRVTRARMIVNAGGPWVGDVIRDTVHSHSKDSVRLVRGSHIVTRRLFDHDKCYFFQGTDGRIMFAIPYETDFTLIGTTDQEHEDPTQPPVCTEAEKDYMVSFVNQYLADPISVDDIVWTYSGVRPLYDDGASSATAATRDYTLKMDHSAGAPVINIFGGKITTYRRLAEGVMELVGEEVPDLAPAWTAGVALPGGDFAVSEVESRISDLARANPFLSDAWARRLIRAYGTEAQEVLGAVKQRSDLGQDFGATLTAAEVDWLMDREYARSADDVLWRRTKLGLRLSKEQSTALQDYMTRRSVRAASAAAE